VPGASAHGPAHLHEELATEPSVVISASYDYLFQAQNSTIALLAGGIDKLLPSSRKMRDLEHRVEQLRTSLSPTVQSKVDPQLDALGASTEAMANAKIESLMEKTDLEGVLRKVDARFEALKVATTDLVSSLMRDLALQTSEILSKKFEVLAKDVLAARPAGPASEAAPSGGAGSPAPVHDLEPGDIVYLQGLAARPELNGRAAAVITPHDGERIAVEVYDTGERIRVRPHSVLRPPPRAPDPESSPPSSGASTPSSAARPCGPSTTTWITSDSRARRA